MYAMFLIIPVMLLTTTGISLPVVSQELPPDEASPQLESHGKMTNERLQWIIRKLDPEFTGSPGNWQLLITNIPVQVVTVQNGDRMRVMVPIFKADALSPEKMYRILQTNYDSAHDARYAISYAANPALTYDKTYSSGGMTFGGGDSGEIIERQLIEELMKRSELIKTSLKEAI
jgi:hypothetical protein